MTQTHDDDDDFDSHQEDETREWPDESDMDQDMLDDTIPCPLQKADPRTIRVLPPLRELCFRRRLPKPKIAVDHRGGSGVRAGDCDFLGEVKNAVLPQMERQMHTDNLIVVDTITGR